MSGEEALHLLERKYDEFYVLKCRPPEIMFLPSTIFLEWIEYKLSTLPMGDVRNEEFRRGLDETTYRGARIHCASEKVPGVIINFEQAVREYCLNYVTHPSLFRMLEFSVPLFHPSNIGVGMFHEGVVDFGVHRQ